jgi:hypothetical protein
MQSSGFRIAAGFEQRLCARAVRIGKFHPDILPAARQAVKQRSQPRR